MKVTIYNWDGTTLEPVFDPAHREAVREFYNNLVANMQIQMFKIWN